MIAPNLGPNETPKPGSNVRWNPSTGLRETLAADTPPTTAGNGADTSATPANTSLDIALALAASGLPVFPCNASKRPAIAKEKQGHGFQDASTDPDRIRELWDLAGPAAVLVGVPAGPVAGFDVLDFDPRHGSDSWRTANIHRLPETRVHGTPGLPKVPTDSRMPGEHWLFRHVDGVRNIQDGQSIAPGIDVRGSGGYVIMPPSAGYTVIHEVDIAPWPDWLLPLVLKAARPAFVPAPTSYATPAKVTDNRLRGFIDREVRRVKDAPQGGRHNARLSAARSIGGVAEQAGVSDREMEEILIAARPPEVEEEKERRTIRDGLAYGRAAPIDLNTLSDSVQWHGHRPHRGNGVAAPEPPPPSPEEEIGQESDLSAEPEVEPEPPEDSPNGTEPEPGGEGEPTEAEAKPEEKKDSDTKPKPLTKAKRAVLLERLADIKEGDPVEFNLERPAAAGRMGCTLGALEEAVDKIIAARVKARKVADAAAAKLAAAVAAEAAAARQQAGPKQDTDAVKALITEFNDRYFVLNEAGKAVIYAPKHDHQLHRDFFERIEFSDLEKLYLNRTVDVGINDDGKTEYKPAAGVWLRHPARHQYIGGMVFDPSGREQPGVRNLWQGFGVTAKPGSCRLFKEHLRTVICCGDPNLYEYVMDWCADAVQHPDRRGQVALVLCGPEGSGKGIFANAMKRLFGQHGLAISNAKHLVGHFNVHLRDCVLLFADEAFYAGDRAHTSILKAIITESDMIVEAKYQNAVSAKNYLHIVMASNDPWVVPASLDSRRFAVIAVALDRVGDLAYFADIQRELEHGGYEALLAELLDRVPFGDIRQIPVTDALITQRKLSLGTTEAENMAGKLNRFAQEYSVHRNGTKAATAAGYSTSHARVQASQLLRRPSVQALVAKFDADLTERTQITKEWVVNETVNTYEKAMEWENPAAARSCLHLLSQLHGYIVEKRDVRIITSVADLSDAELAAVAGTVIEGEVDPIEPEGSG